MSHHTNNLTCAAKVQRRTWRKKVVQCVCCLFEEMDVAVAEIIDQADSDGPSLEGSGDVTTSQMTISY